MLRLKRLLVLTFLGVLSGCAGTAALMPLPSERLTEVRSAQPSADYHWVVGYFRWESGQKEYIWVRGRWAKVVLGHRWLKGSYRTIAREDVQVYQWTPGRWVERRRSAAPGVTKTETDVESELEARPRGDME